MDGAGASRPVVRAARLHDHPLRGRPPPRRRLAVLHALARRNGPLAGGVYREIVEPERLVFTHAWEDEEGKPGHQTLVTVTFAEQDGKTRLAFHQAVFESVADRDSHREGWTECLDRLEGYLGERSSV
jgi:uncharacterized protein YndB with AHSA1/START domain